MSSKLDILPGWVQWVGPGMTVLIVLVVFLVTPVGVIRVARGRADDLAPWTERARWTHVATASALTSTIFLPAVAVLLVVILIGPLSAVSAPVVAAVVSLLGILGSIAAFRHMTRWAYGEAAGMRQAFAGWILTFAPIAMFALLGWFAPASFASWLMIPWVLAGVGIVAVWLRLPLLLIPMGLGRAGDDRLVDGVSRASRDAGVHVDRIVELYSARPNAFAAPWISTLVFTTAMLEITTDDELEAICHHELAHFGEPAGTIRLRQMQLLVFIPIAALKPLLNSVGIFGVLAVLLAALGILDLVRRRGVSAEAVADGVAIQASHQSVAFGRAIEKAYRIGLIPAVVRRPSHGQLHERLEVAGIEVDFEIPKPPSFWPHPVGLSIAVLVIVVGVLSPWAVASLTTDDSWTPTLLAATLPLYGNGPLLELAWDAEMDRRWADAATLYELAAEVQPDSWVHVSAAYMWEAAGDCKRTQQARDRIEPGPDFEEQWSYANSSVDRCDLAGGT